MIWFVLFAGVLGTAPADMQPKVLTGPWPTIEACAAQGALAINHLNGVFPDRDFRGTCSTSQTGDGAARLDMQQLAALAGVK